MDLKKEGARLPLSRLLRWYLGFYRDDKLRIASGATMALLQSVALVPIPLFFQKMIDVRVPAKDIHGIILDGSIVFGLYILHAVLTFGSTTMTLLATKRITETLRARLCIQLQQMSLRFHDIERASELHSRVVMDTERIDVMGNAITVPVMSSIVLFFGSAVLLAALNIKLFVIFSIMIPLYFFSYWLLRRRMKKVHRDFRDEMEMMNAQVNDLLHAIRLVKTFAREDHEQRRAEERFQHVTKSALAMTIFTAFFNSLMAFLMNFTRLLLYAFGAVLIIWQALTVGELIAFVSMLVFLIQPINVVITSANTIYAGFASLGPVHALLNFDEPLEELENKETLEYLDGSVEFENVSIIYDSNQKHALRNVSFNVKPGETIALVGESGAGKSTIASAILGFYLPDSGTVRIDGKNIRDLELRSLRECVGVVTQDNVLLNTSIRENILYGRMTATEEELREAAHMAHALHFIEEIAGGFDAVVGDRGTRLSGGQRQRIAIARAILKDPKILILDEATSALDSESEAQIQQALEHLQQNRTCFIIAHRLSTIANADRIFVMKDGRIVEEGPHQELLAEGGEYARLCERQFGRLETG